MRLGLVESTAASGGPSPEFEKCRGEPLTPSRRLDDLQFIKTIGTGTFGRVILVQEKSSGEFGALKVLALADLVRLKQVEHVKNEKSILASVQHPFIIHMRWDLKDSSCIYMLFEYVSGGEMFTYLRNAGHFSDSTSCFYAAEILLALEYLHRLDIVYRDLKPENVLLDATGHVKLLDFGFSKRTRHPCWTICGTPDYLAPEIIQSKGHNKAVDYWALGVLIYEMVIGWPPFHAQDPLQTYERIVVGTFSWPETEIEWKIEGSCRDLVTKLLVADRTRRLGCMRAGSEDVKNHRWFSNIHFEHLLNKRTQGPIVPVVRWVGDTGNFGEYPEEDASEGHLPLPPDQLALFQDF